MKVTEMMKTLRTRAGLWVLSAWMKRTKTSNQTPTFSAIRRIGILIPMNEPTDLQWAIAVSQRLSNEGKTCDVLGFSTLPQASSIPINMMIIGSEDLKWNFIPKEDAIKSFISTNFDVLLNLCTDSSCLPLDYIAIRADAAFRIGRYEPTLANAYGMMFKGSFSGSDGLFEATNRYLRYIQ